MRKISIIGAGSVVFCKTLLLDIMATKGLEETHFWLMAPSTRNTSKVYDYMMRVIAHNNLKCKISVTTNRQEALKDADYVIATLQIGGLKAYELEYEIPYKYGVDQCIGDTLGPGGIFRALRTIPIMMDLANDMKELCPDALLLNYVNPMAMICWALGTTGIKFVGLCHGVQTTLDLISSYAQVPKSEVKYTCAGINHMGWFLDIKHNGKDLYPILKQKFELPQYYVNEKVRGEVFRQFGYFMTESTGHLSEYLPYFRKSQRALDLYCDEPAFGGESGAYLKFSKYVVNKYNGKDVLANESIELPSRSVEYGSYIIEAIELNKTFHFNGNVINNAMISNLPDDCCSEGPMFADADGLHQCLVGNLPPQCAALNMTNINVQRLAVIAALDGNTENIVHALCLDPLTSAKLTLDEIREMAIEMLEAHREYLPQFEGKFIRPTPIIDIPKDVERVDVPLDPALAIAARFGKLSQ